MRRIFVMGLASAAALLSAGAEAQPDAAAALFGRSNFAGPELRLTGPTQHIDPPFVARSIRLPAGSAWELCSGSTYSGCRRLDAPVTGGVFKVRSARPVAPVIASSASISNETLRGVASQFFVAPAHGSERVALPGNDPEAMRRGADDFCRSAGWQQSAHARLQIDSGTYYLVDVLCENGGR